MKLTALCICWVLGIYIGSICSPSLWPVFPAIACCVLVLALRHRMPASVWVGLCLVAFLGGVACYQWRHSDATVQSFADGRVVEVIGEVKREPQSEGGTASLYLAVRQIKTGGDWEGISGDVLVSTSVYPSHGQGEILSVTGTLQSLSEINSAEYRSYLSGQGIGATMFDPEIETVQHGWLPGLREQLASSLSRALPEPHGSLAEALLLGIQNHIPDDLREAFRVSGTSHILAVSGMNVAMLAGVMLGMAAWVFGRRRHAYLVVTLAAVWLYALLAGMESPVMRSAIMFSLFLLALWVGRPASALPSLALAAAVMVGLEPGVLWDVPFQLSFVSVSGLVLLVPPLDAAWEERVVPKLEGRLPMTSFTRLIVYPLMISLAATVATYPLVAYYFGRVSVVGLPATFLALVALPATLVLVLLTAVLGMFAAPLAAAVGWVAWLFISYIIKVVDGFGALPFASYKVVSVSAAAIWAYYGVVVAVLCLKRLRIFSSSGIAWMRTRLAGLPKPTWRVRRRWVIVPLCLVAALVWLAVLAVPAGQLEVSFLDVGEGDAILIRTPSGRQVLIDGGPAPETICLELGKRLSFWDKSLDLVVLTHADDDHILGLVEVLGHYEVGQVLESGLEESVAEYRDKAACVEWRGLIEENNIERIVAEAGQRIDLGGGVVIDVLSPHGGTLADSEEDVNDSSVVLRLSWREVSFLLTGDISEEMERLMLHDGADLTSTVLKVAHHGGATSTSPQFLAAVDPTPGRPSSLWVRTTGLAIPATRCWPD
ncbi:MAG: ComEC/Rec2 family competence protein [Chloroflexi bacterium]|nr:ComEC/Rec2 family competence protein [Chloroflexota bacterium]